MYWSGTLESNLSKCIDVQLKKPMVYNGRPLSSLLSSPFLPLSYHLSPSLKFKSQAVKNFFSKYLPYLNNSKALQHTEVQGITFSSWKLSRDARIHPWIIHASPHFFLCVCGICEYVSMYVYTCIFVCIYICACIHVQEYSYDYLKFDISHLKN